LPPVAWATNSVSSRLSWVASVLKNRNLIRGSVVVRVTNSSTTALIGSIPPSRSNSVRSAAGVAAGSEEEVAGAAGSVAAGAGSVVATAGGL